MRINRKTSIILALGIIVLFFTIAHLTAPSRGQKAAPPTSNSTDTVPTATPKAAATPDAESQFELQHFQRSETRDGKKVWEVIADNGRFYPEADITRLTNATVTSLREDNSKIVIISNSADIKLAGTELSSAHLTGDVHVTMQDEMKLTTDDATYTHAEQSVVAPHAVSIEGPFYKSRGDSMKADTEEQVITLTGNVRTEIEPVPDKKEKK
jgi:LPS export ABC transporter protein LptC